MVRFTLNIPDALNARLIQQAKLNHRSKHSQVVHILESACDISQSTPTYQTGSTTLCNNGKHHFMKPQPDNGEFCNCGMFMLGEVISR